MKHSALKSPEATEIVLERLKTLPGLVSIHGQYAEPLAIIVVIVNSKQARLDVLDLETELIREHRELPLELHVHHLPSEEIETEHKALAQAYDLIWSKP